MFTICWLLGLGMVTVSAASTANCCRAGRIDAFLTRT